MDTSSFKLCCRLCLVESSTLKNVFSIPQESTGLIDTISELTGVKIAATDRITTRLCEKCSLVILNFDTFRSVCLQNQLKLLKRLTDFEAAVLNHSIQIKDEPPDDEDDVVFVPNAEQVKDELMAALSVDCPNRDDDQPPMLSPNLPTAMDTSIVAQPPVAELKLMDEGSAQDGGDVDADMEDESLIQAEEIIEEEEEEEQQQHDKILFAAGLQLQSRKFSSVNNEPMTAVELAYAHKHALVYSQVATFVCCCHNDHHATRRKFFKHIKYYGKLHLPLNSCYKCCTTFGPKSEACKHRLVCAKKELEAFPNAFSTEERGVNKHRLYQMFYCVKCHSNYRVFEEYCRHIEKHIADADFACICGRSAGHAYTYKHHVFMACLLHYTCDVCATRVETIEAFKAHCAQVHDTEAGEQYDVHEAFVVQDIHAEKAYACVECNLKCAKAATIIAHLQQVHSYDMESATKMSLDCYVGGTACDDLPPTADALADDPKHPSGACTRECDICCKSFGSPANLRRHKDEVHYMRRRMSNYRCGDCNQSFSMPKYLEVHLERHHSYPCDSCNAKYTSEAELELHRRSHLRLSLTREPGTTNYKASRCCDQCTHTFQTDDELEAHMQAHQDEMPTLLMEDPRDVKSLEAQCRICKRLFVGQRGLAVHIARQHGSALLQRDKLHSFPKTCPKCGEVLRTINDWFLHAKGHERETLADPDHGSGLLDCDECGKHFAGKKYLKRHMRLHGVLYYCADCKYKTNDEDEWQAHLDGHQQRNQKERSVAITTTGPNTVSNHVRKLPNGKLLCKECGKITDTLESMRVHIGWHKRNLKNQVALVPKEEEEDEEEGDDDDNDDDDEAEDEEEAEEEEDEDEDDDEEPPKVNLAAMFNEKHGKSFVCITCGELFPHQQVLQAHIVTTHGREGKGKRHTSIQCVLCNISFSTVDEFTEHDRVHLMADKNNSQCRLCGKILARIDNLREHMKNLHKLIEMLHCPYCSYTTDKRFAYNSHVRDHKMQSSTADESKVLSTWQSMGLAKYTCSICGVGFDSGSEMRGHIIAEHPFF